MGSQRRHYLELEFLFLSVLVFEELKVGFVFGLYVLLLQYHQVSRHCDVVSRRALVSLFHRSSGGGSAQTTVFVSPHDSLLSYAYHDNDEIRNRLGMA